MKKGDPYEVIVSRLNTEKATTLANLATSTSNACVAKCETPKAMFLVHPDANKAQIASAVEQIYSEKGVKVLKVNTIRRKQKPRRVRGRQGMRASFKKAIVTLQKGDQLEEI